MNMVNYLEKVFKKKKSIVTVREEAVESICAILEDYSEWYDRQGLYLPPDYATDPSQWSEALHKMKRAFRLLYDEMHEEGELWEAKNKWKKYGEKDEQKVEELEKEVREGLALFGQQLFYLNDPKVRNH